MGFKLFFQIALGALSGLQGLAKEKIFFQAGVFPGNLLPVAGQAHVQTHALEHVFNLHAFFDDFFEQMFGIESIAARTGIARRLAWCRRVSQKGIGRCFHLRQTFGNLICCGKRVVAASIQDDDVGAVFGGLETACELGNVHSVVAYILCVGKVLVNGQQIVAPLRLHRMPRKIKHTRLLAGMQQVTKSAHGGFHLVAVLVNHFGHGKARVTQTLRDRTRIVGRIDQGRMRIFAIPNHQGKP